MKNKVDEKIIYLERLITSHLELARSKGYPVVKTPFTEIAQQLICTIKALEHYAYSKDDGDLAYGTLFKLVSVENKEIDYE